MPTIEPKSVIDTSKMSPAQREALELTESAREAAQSERGFAGGLFMGRLNLPQIHPFSAQSVEDSNQGDAFLQRLETFLKEHVDPDEIDRTGEIPQEVIDGLAQMGAFGIKISPQFGGLGLSQTNYCRAGTMLGSFCGNLTALISAHQSIGVPQPLILFGTEEQKRRFLPRVARGEISAFATAGAAAVSCDGGPRAEVGTRAGFARALCRYWRGNLRDRHQLRAGAVDAGHARKYQYGIACACRLPLLRVAVAH